MSLLFNMLSRLVITFLPTSKHLLISWTGHGTTDWFQIGKRIHQGCILSPYLFNLYAEYIIRNDGLEETQAGIKIARRNINNLRYANDTTLMAESEELKSVLMKMNEESEKVGLKLNIQKTKIMASGPITSWQIDGETVADFIFLDSKITADGDCSHEIKRHLLHCRYLSHFMILVHFNPLFKLFQNSNFATPKYRWCLEGILADSHQGSHLFQVASFSRWPVSCRPSYWPESLKHTIWSTIVTSELAAISSLPPVEPKLLNSTRSCLSGNREVEAGSRGMRGEWNGILTYLNTDRACHGPFSGLFPLLIEVSKSPRPGSISPLLFYQAPDLSSLLALQIPLSPYL